MAFAVVLTLEPIKSHHVQYLLWLLDGLTQSPSEAVPLYLDLFWEGPEALLAGGQSVALWEEVVQNSLCLFTGTPQDGVSSSALVGVLNYLLRASNIALLAVCDLQSDSSEWPLVIPLAFSDLALARLGGPLLMGESGVEVLLICALHWSLLLQGLSVE